MANPSSPNIEAIRRANAEYVENFLLRNANLAAEPSRKLLVVTCMDARLHPTSAFGLALGSTHIVRNAGGSAKDALNSIITSQTLQTNETLLIKHTKCGVVPDAELESSVREDVNFLKNHDRVRGSISGWVYDVSTGGVRRII